MRRSFWFRLFDRDIVIDPQQIVDAMRAARGLPGDDHSLPFDLGQRRADTLSPTHNLRIVYTSLGASPLSVDLLVSPADRLDVLAAFGFTINPASPAEEATPLESATADSHAIAPDPVIRTQVGVGNPLPGDGLAHATAQFGPMVGVHIAGGTWARFPTQDTQNFIVSYSDNLQSGLVYDAITKTVLAGGTGNWPELGAGSDDVLELSGDFSGGVDLPSELTGIDRIVLREGHDYNLVANDNNVGIGETLTIDAMPLQDTNHVSFDGRAETDGSYLFFGSETGDLFFGGAGNDRIFGFGGPDTLSGGGGSDIFVYTGAGDSSGANYDTLADFNPLADRIDLPGSVSGFGATIESGSLSTATFNDDLGAALGNLGASQAVWFTPDEGDLAGQIFLIVDGNGQAGYQEGEDFVFAVAGSPLSDLTGHTDFFI